MSILNGGQGLNDSVAAPDETQHAVIKTLEADAKTIDKL